jgi:predicted ATP-binding protein involved in virulence
MSIDKNDIEKYIFDPSNPKQCKSYNLLLKNLKKESFSFFSPEFLQYFFANQIFDKDFELELWDKPNNFNELVPLEKFRLFIEQLSIKELNEFIKLKVLNLDKLSKYNFLNNFLNIEQELYEYYTNGLRMPGDDGKRTGYESTLKIFEDENIEDFLKKEIDNMHLSDKNYKNDVNRFSNKEYNNHFIIFSKDYFKILEGNIKRSSIFITLEKNIDKFLYYNQNNIKPIFLKKMEDVELLLNVLQEDLKKEKQKDIEREEISTLKSIEINDFFSIKNLRLKNLEDKKEIYLVGENGDGKSLFLQALALGLKGISEGDVFDTVKSQKEYILKIVDTNDNIYDSKNQEYKNLFAYGANRNNNCQMKEDETGYLTLFNASLDLKNPIDWLIYLDHSEKSGKKNIISVDSAKKLLQELLNSDIQIDIFPDKVVFTEKGSIVDFKQLSAGYKGVITILTDLLARLSENQPYVKKINDFKGIVLIDEIELHLHPKWKYDLVKKLRDIFPQIQFIMTTHSPTVILGASKEAVFYKIYKEEGEVKISNQIANEGYTSNSLVSSPLFDLETITSRDYDKRISSDDYVYDKIHERISLKIKEDIKIDENEILKLIDKELDNL